MSDENEIIKISQMVEYQVVQEGEITEQEMKELFDLPEVLAEKHIAERLPVISSTIDRLEALAALEKERAEKYYKRSQAMNNAVKRIKDYLQYQMTVVGIKEVAIDGYSVRLQKSPEKLVFSDTKLIPDEYYKTTVLKEIDKEKIKLALKEGNEIAGASLQCGEHIRLGTGKPVHKLVKG